MENTGKRSASLITLQKIGQASSRLAPYFGLILVTVIFSILTDGTLVNVRNLKSMSNSVIYTALCSIGAVFVFGAGFFDMSVSGMLCLSAVLGGYAAIATGSLLVAALVILAVCLALGLLKGLLAAYVNLPYFIFTIILVTVLNSVVITMMGNESTIYLRNAVKEIPSFSFDQLTIINVACLSIFFLLCLVIFNFTSFGIRVKCIGGNLICAKQSGIPVKGSIILAFLISSIGIAISSFIILIRTRTVGATTASSVGNDVMVALVLGGMPLSGGPRSKISAGLVGACTITVLNSGLTILGLSVGQIQIFRGVIFILVVFLSSFSYRRNLLPR